MIWNLSKYKNNIALWDEFNNKITYFNLNMEVHKITSIIGKRCLVFCLCSNKIGSIIGYISFMNGMIPPIMISSHLEETLLSNLLDTYSPKYIWCPAELKEQFTGMECVYQIYDYILLKTGYKKNYPLNDNLGILLTTSGSTGSPKLVRQSYINVLDNTQSIANYLSLDYKERPITTLPMNYTYGLSIINSHILVGATILISDKSIMQKEFWDFFKKAGATSFGGVPYTYEMLDRLRFYRMELPSLHTMTQAGGKILPELQEKFAKYANENGKQFIVMYGQCEATARMGYLPFEKASEKIGSIGIAIPNGKFHLIDTKGKEITQPYTTGELVYEGKNVTLGYAECGDDLIKDDERNGVLETGDMAQFDDEGYFYIVGRKKRFLKIFGNRVNLDEVDNLIKSMFSIEVASAGEDDKLYLFIVDSKYTELVKELLTNKTKLNPIAFKVVLVKEIPKNDAGKILYKELEKYFK